MVDPPSCVPTEPPGEPPVVSSRDRSNANLNKGLSPNQEKGPDGKIRRKQTAQEPIPELTLPPGDDDDLAAMRWVVRNKEDRTEAHRTYRAWLNEDRPGFMRALTALARVVRKPADETPQEKQEAEEVEEDEATDRILELIAEAWASHVAACAAAGGDRQFRLPGVSPQEMPGQPPLVRGNSGPV
jgi:hypothetical protein